MERASVLVIASNRLPARRHSARGLFYETNIVFTSVYDSWPHVVRRMKKRTHEIIQ